MQHWRSQGTRLKHETSPTSCQMLNNTTEMDKETTITCNQQKDRGPSLLCGEVKFLHKLIITRVHVHVFSQYDQGCTYQSSLGSAYTRKFKRLIFHYQSQPRGSHPKCLVRHTYNNYYSSTCSFKKESPVMEVCTY